MSSHILLWEEGAFADLNLINETLRSHQFEVLKPIGSGSYAGVYAVKSLRYGQDFVAKVSLHDGCASPEDSTEISVLKTIVHHHIVAIYDAFSDKKFLYVILEYCQGGSLKTLVSDSGPIPAPRVHLVCYQIADALLECHRHRIAHQDIKPANVLLDQYGRPKLADFGLSQQFDNDMRAHTRVGSLAYMAPEVISGGHRDAFLSDVWSLGVTFYFIAIGKMPWQADTSYELETIIRSGVYPTPANVNPNFRTILRKMLTVDVTQRPPLEWVVEQLKMLAQECSAEKTSDPTNGRLAYLRGSLSISNSGSWANGLMLASVPRRISNSPKPRAETFTSNLVE